MPKEKVNLKKKNMGKSTRPWMVIGLIMLVLAIVLVYYITTKDKHLNLLIVLVDTLRSDHLGYHGYSTPTSPQIDSLARKSIVFMNHYSQSSRTGPSVASIFTGLHPRSHGVINPLSHFDAKGTLSDAQVTLAEILKKNGYSCYGYIANPNITSRFGFGQGFDHYEFLTSMAAPDLNRMANRIIEEEKGPFFLYLHYMEPHSPYKAPRSYGQMFIERGYGGPINGSHQQLDEIVAGRLIPGPEDVRHLEALYDQEIRYFDDMFVQLLNSLEKNNLHDNTLVMFMADHGEEFWDHGSVLHGYTLYEEQLHVPMFIYDPRRESPSSVDAITRHIDLLPTILEILGIEDDVEVQGRSLLPWVEGRETSPAVGPVYAQVSLRAVKIVKLASFMKDGWKLIANDLPEKSEELYHIQRDPKETQNVYTSEEKMARLVKSELTTFEKSLPKAKVGEIELTDEEIERLRSLGYIK